MAAFLKRASRNESLHGALALALLLVLFLWTPISRYGEVHYAPADLTQDFSLTKIEPGHASGNRLMSDAVTQMEPWLMFNRAELQQGRLPLWNPWNGAGCPHFANFQSAVFSPFSLPYYLFDFKAALLVSAFLKLWTLGFLTFLFLKELRLRQVSALVGATVFMFAGHNVLLLYFPHVGAAAALPGGLLFAEKALRRFEEGRRSRVGPLAGLVLSLAAGLLAGNPEPFYFSIWLVAAFVAWRLVSLARRFPGRRREVGGLALELLLAGALAAGLGAFQVLPFLEFLKDSRVLEQRSLVQTPLEARFWPLCLFPNALGNPSTPYNLSYTVPPPTFELVNTAYVGGLATFVALGSIVFARRDGRVAFFWGAGAAWTFYAYDLLGAARLFALVPTVDLAPMNRSQPIGLFCASAGAALGIDHVLARGPGRAWEGAVATALAAAAFLVACLIGVDRLIEDFATHPSPNHDRFLEFVPGHVTGQSWTFLAGASALAFLWLARGAVLRAAAGSAVLAVVFLQSGWLLRDYNPVTEDRYFFPVTPAIEDLKETVGNDRVAILGEDGLPPDSNLAYGIALVPNYDGMWVRDLDLLHRVMFGDTHNWRPIVRGSERALKLFGIEWVLAKWDWVFVDSGLSRIAREPDQRFAPQEVLPRREIVQTFLCERPGLQAVAVTLGVHPTSKPCTLAFRLEEADSGAVVCEREVTSEEIAADIYTNQHVAFPLDVKLSPPGRPVVFAFDPRPDSEGRSYRITLSAPQGIGGHTVIAWAAVKRTYTEGEGRRGDKPLPGELLFDYSCVLDRFERVKTIGDYGLYRYRGSLGRAWAVRGSAVAQSDADALDLLRVPTFDPGRLVVLSSGEREPPPGATPIPKRDPSQCRLVKTRDSVKVYVVCPDGRSIVHIEDEATFLANGFRWDRIETIPREEFERFTIVRADLELERQVGLRVIAPPSLDEAPVRTVLETPTSLRFEVERKEPGYLVVAQAHFPGWRARVNGVETTVHRANHAFDAIELKPGLNVVDLWYDPKSLKIGSWISLGAALLGLFCLIRPPR